MKSFLISDLIKLLILENYFSKKNILETETQPIESSRDNQDINHETPKMEEGKPIKVENFLYYSPKRTIPGSVFYMPVSSYTQQLIKKRDDFLHNVPNKNLKWHPTQLMGGVLGYTYLGAGTINKRDDLVFKPGLSYEVDVHESIHTEWEYQTRILTAWMLSEDPYFRKY